MKNKSKRSLLMLIKSNIPGIREYISLSFIVLIILLFLVIFSSYLFIKSLQIGQYADTIISRNAYVIIIFWIVSTIILFLIFVRKILEMSEHIVGPTRRIERELDKILNGEKNIHIVLRRSDILFDVVKKINQVLDMFEKKYDKDSNENL
ncbi:MAG: hypothetical protein ABID79_05225 [Elusimicrobiota bacterium]